MRGDSGITRREILAGAVLGTAVAAVPRLAFAGGPQGQLTWAIHVSLAPTWFDPAETPGIITPFMVMYALHDAMVKPMPGNMATPSLAESFAASEDSLTYDFVIRPGAKFHSGDPVTAEDVKFPVRPLSRHLQRLAERAVAAVEIADERHVRFKLKKPWPDFLTFYSSAAARAGSCRRNISREGRRRGFQEAPDWGRAVQICLVHAGRRAGDGSQRGVLA